MKIQFLLTFETEIPRRTMKQSTFTERHLPWILILLIFCLLSVVSLLSEGHYGGADSVNHYFISRYAFQYPRLFFDTWGRPLFNILSAPFAQFGFGGVKFFNILLGCMTAFLSFLIGKKINLSRPYLIILFVVFTPMYFLMLPTALTEILFGFILVLSVYLFFRGNFILSAVVIGFLPFARSEGIVLIPVFFLAFLFKRRFTPILFLLTGFIILSAIGTFVFKDFFWIISHSPYPLHHPIYKEKGPLLHFVINSRLIFGVPLLFLFLLGTGTYLKELFSKDRVKRSSSFIESWVIIVPVFLFFAVHSVLYWKALFGSMGLLRVITGVLPLAAILSLKGFEYLERTLTWNAHQRRILLYTTIGLVVITNFVVYSYPVKLGPEELTVKKAVGWVKEAKLSHHQIIFTDLDVPFFMDIDPYNDKRCTHQYFLKYLNDHADSSVFIWDAHFGPNESFVPLDSLMRNPNYKLLNLFHPAIEMKTLGGYPYEVYVFYKVRHPRFSDNGHIRDSIINQEENSFKTRYIDGITFERITKNIKEDHRSTDFIFSGKYAYKLAGEDQYGPEIEKKLSGISVGRQIIIIRATLYVYPLVSFKENPTDLVISLKRRSDGYHALKFEELGLKTNQWNKVVFQATLPLDNPSDRLTVYLWHRGKQALYIDNLKVEAVVPK